MQLQFQHFSFCDVFIDAQPTHRSEKLTRLYFKMFVSKIKEINWLALTRLKLCNARKESVFSLAILFGD